MRFKKTALTSIAMSALALCAAPALGATSDDGTSQGKARAVGGQDLSGEISAALQRDLDLSASQVKEQRALQAKAIKLDESLQDSLAGAYAGSSYNAKAGKLVVMVSDEAQAGKARAAGADVRVVKHSKAKLDAIKGALDAASGKRGSGPADREASGARQAIVAGMTSWYVDTAKNTVHVTVDKAHADEAARSLAKYGDAVTIVASDQAPVPTDRYQDGGDAINGGSCSTGFNLRNPSTGKGYLLTAGHCVSAGSTLYGHEGWPFAFGPVLESWFPGVDDALARNDTGFYIQGPWVDTDPSHGGVITTRGYTDAPIGTWICKSGITTKWTCGQITGKDQTVFYSGYGTVYGLTRHNACVEPGDSGGSNVAVMTGYPAEGVTSGAYLYWDGSRYRCGSAFGYSNVSYYFPIADSLAWYGPRYGVTTWW